MISSIALLLLAGIFTVFVLIVIFSWLVLAVGFCSLFVLFLLVSSVVFPVYSLTCLFVLFLFDWTPSYE